MYEGYLSVAGREIGNNARVSAYKASGSGPCGCPDLAEALDHAPYLSPADDPAPWYDPNEPESRGFGGFWIESIEGLLDTPLSLTPTQRLGHGAQVPRARMRDRVLTVTGWIYATDTCSADWGLRWLTSQLLSCGGCDGGDICFLRCCPDGPDDLDRQLRTLRNGKLISGPEKLVVAPLPANADCHSRPRPALQIQFQLSADPWIWRTPVTVVDEIVWPDPDENDPVCNIIWDTSGQCDPDNPNCVPGLHVPGTGCAGNPMCPPPPAPPRIPTASTGCACIPLYVTRTCVDITAEDIPASLASALRLRIYSGDQAIRNMAITVYPNPRQLPGDELDDCRACGTYYIEHIPPESSVVIDGTTSSTRMLCPGGVDTRADHVVYGDGGGPASHVLLQCGTHYTICADMDVESFSPMATLTVERITREV